MPEMHYRLCWPDLSESDCYSPSLVIRDFFVPGADYALEDFLRRIRAATHIASERVREKYGFPCARAAAQLHVIEQAAQRFASGDDCRVVILSFTSDD